MKVLEHLGEGNIKQRQGTQHQLSGVVPLQYTTTALVSSLQYEAERQAWQSLNPHYMSEEESDGETLIVHSPSWRSTRKLKHVQLINFLTIQTHAVVLLLHVFIFQIFRTWCRNWMPGKSGTTVVADRGFRRNHDSEGSPVQSRRPKR